MLFSQKFIVLLEFYVLYIKFESKLLLYLFLRIKKQPCNPSNPSNPFPGDKQGIGLFIPLITIARSYFIIVSSHKCGKSVSKISF